MGKTIWIINDYAGSPYHGMEYRHYYLAKEWIKNGHHVYIITASYSHLFRNLPKVNQSFTFENIDGIKYIWVKVPKYNKSTDKRRVLKWLTFTFMLFGLPLKKIKKPDIIISSPMATFSVLPAYRLSKKFGANFIFEVKDIWPLSIIELGNISPNHPLVKMMRWCEKFGVKKADYIVSTLQNYGEYLKNNLKINRDFIWINNGINLDEFQKIEPLPNEIINQIPKNKFIIGYAGTIGIANVLEYLLKAAEKLENFSEIHFLVVGEGSEKEKLIKKYSHLLNVTFINSIKKNQIQSILSFFDVCYIGWRKKRIYNYGISANKIFDYMYSGNPILHAYSGNGDLIKLSNCGITVESENTDAIVQGILEFYNMDRNKRKILGENGKKYVLEHFTYDKLAKKYEEIF